MNVEVTAKQPNSTMCFVCGVDNRFGLKSRFFELENGEIAALFTPAKEHQGYPGRLHGGIAATILDETIGRAVMIKYSNTIWGVTVDFSLRYKKPVPLTGQLRVRGRIIRDRKRMFEGTGELLLPDGTVAIEASGKYLKMDISKITDADFVGESWGVVTKTDDPTVIELPET